jgi:PadR family transcriptional regulator, regulatory protein PadR
MSRAPLSLLQGTVDILILKTLTWGPQHGYGISQWLKVKTDGELLVEDAALYQALHRLERKSWVESEWGISDTNRRAKFYSITRAGRDQLKAELASMRRYVAALFKVLEPA